MTGAMLESVPAQLQAEFEEAVRDLLAGVRRPDKIREACERMDRMREANRLQFGEQDIAVSLVRETRGT